MRAGQSVASSHINFPLITRKLFDYIITQRLYRSSTETSRRKLLSHRSIVAPTPSLSLKTTYESPYVQLSRKISFAKLSFFYPAMSLENRIITLYPEQIQFHPTPNKQTLPRLGTSSHAKIESRPRLEQRKKRGGRREKEIKSLLDPNLSLLSLSSCPSSRFSILISYSSRP